MSSGNNPSPFQNIIYMVYYGEGYMVKLKMAFGPAQKMKILGYLCFWLKHHKRKKKPTTTKKANKTTNKTPKPPLHFLDKCHLLTFKTTGNWRWFMGSDFSVDWNLLCDLEEKSYKPSVSENRCVNISLENLWGCRWLCDTELESENITELLWWKRINFCCITGGYGHRTTEIVNFSPRDWYCT